jgi:hypothetical protein
VSQGSATAAAAPRRWWCSWVSDVYSPAPKNDSAVQLPPRIGFCSTALSGHCQAHFVRGAFFPKCRLERAGRRKGGALAGNAGDAAEPVRTLHVAAEPQFVLQSRAGAGLGAGCVGRRRKGRNHSV